MAQTNALYKELRQLLNWSKAQWALIAVIFLLATGLRLYKLGQVPEGLTWDEAAIGYNGSAVWQYRRDEWLDFLPISFKSFGDYKAPLAIYINGLFTIIFGHEPWVIRLPFALAGLGSLLGMLLLTRLLLEQQVSSTKTNLSLHTPIVILALMAINPWHLHFSRIGLESGISLFFLIWAVLMFVFSYRFSNRNVRLGLYAVSAICFASSMYAYHSTKIIVPLFLLGMCGYQLMRRKNFWPSLLVGSATVVLLLPMAYSMIFGAGNARAAQTTVFNSQTALVQSLGLSVNNFFVHLSPNFLIFGGTNTLRHSDGRWGVLYSTEFLLMCLGLMVAVFRYKKLKSADWMVLIGLAWVGASLLPAAIGKEVPHPNRALLALPGFYLIMASSIHSILFYSESRRFTWVINPLTASVWVFVCLHLLLTIRYLNNYYTYFSADSAGDFLSGYSQAVKIALEYQNDRQVIFSNKYGQPYIYFLLAKKISPMEYQYGALNMFKFVDKVTLADLEKPNSLIVATPEEIEPTFGTQLVLSQSGEVRFVIIDTVEQCKRVGKGCYSQQ